MIVADTGAVVALVDADDESHAVLRRLFEEDPGAWVPWAILPEVDYLLGTRIGPRVEEAFLADLADHVFGVHFGVHFGDLADLARARDLCRQHRGLRFGLVDAVVMAVADRFGAEAIATLDLRHFGAVKLRGSPRLVPRDL